MTSKSFAAFISDCLSPLGNFHLRPMMGEYCLYYNGKLTGLVCDNRLMVKETETSRDLLSDCDRAYPYEGSRTLMYVVEDPENREKMQILFEGLFRELPEKTKKEKVKNRF